MQQNNQGDFESMVVHGAPKTTKRTIKAAHKTREKDRKQLLVSLFPYIDESKLANNVKKESGM